VYEAIEGSRVAGDDIQDFERQKGASTGLSPARTEDHGWYA